MEPSESLKDVIHFTFNNLSSHNLYSMVAQFSESVGDILLPWVAVYLVERTSIEPNLHTLYLDFLDCLGDSSLRSLTLQESYRRIGLAFHADLSFNPSFDKTILKNLCHWLGLQTLARGFPVSTEALPLCDIIITAYHRGSQDLLFAVPLATQILMAGSHSIGIQSTLPCVRDVLSLLAWLHTQPRVKVRIVLDIEILFSHLSLQLSDFQSLSAECHPLIEVPSIPDVKQNKEGTEQPKHSPPHVTFPQEIGKTVDKRGLTTFSVDDLNKEIREHGGIKKNPLFPTKVKSSFGTPPMHNEDSSVATTGSSIKKSNTEGSMMKQRGDPSSPIEVKNNSFPTHVDDSSVFSNGTQSCTEDSLSKIFQSWPNYGMTNGSIGDPMSLIHSEPSQWRDSMADQDIYIDPWDKTMKAMNTAKMQGTAKPGDYNSLERRQTFSNGNPENGARMGPLNRTYSVDQQRYNFVEIPRSGASFEDLYNRSAETAFTDNFKKKGASYDNLSSLDPTSPPYVYKKALKNHERYYQSGAQMSCDKNSDTAIRHSLV